jgi:hypothetical protein
MRSLYLVLLCILSLASSVFAANTHGKPDVMLEQQAWFGDMNETSVLPGTCEPLVPAASLTFASFTCKGYVRGTTADLVYIDQAAATVGPLSSGNGTYWLAIHRSKTASVTGWTRQNNTHYLWKFVTAIPAEPSEGRIFARVTVAAGAISAVVPLYAGDSPLGTLNGVVFVHKHATAGDGSIARPYTGWDTKVPWVSGWRYIFKGTNERGYYAYATTPNWALDYIQLLGIGEVTLVHTGVDPTEDAVKFVATTTNQGIVFENFTVQGSGNDRHGVYVSGITRSRFANIAITGAGTIKGALVTAYAVLNTFENIYISTNYKPFYNEMLYGVFLDKRGAGETTTGNVFKNVMVEGLDAVGAYGFYLNEATSNMFEGGASEGNHHGLYISTNSSSNIFDGMFFELNTVSNIDVFGFSNTFRDITSSGAPSSGQVIVEGASYSNLFRGGTYSQDFSIIAGANVTHLDGINVAGSLVDNGTNTLYHGVTGAFTSIDRVVGIDSATAGAALKIAPNGNGFTIGGGTGTPKKSYQIVGGAYDPANIPTGTQVTTVLSGGDMTGAAPGDICLASFNLDLQGITLSCYVSVANTVTFVLFNGTGGAIDLGSGTIRAYVLHF